MTGTKFVFYSFKLGDVDDVELYAAQPIWEWQQTEQGKWVMEHAYDLTWHRTPDEHTFGYSIKVTGKLSGKNLTYYMLQWGMKEVK